MRTDFSLVKESEHPQVFHFFSLGLTSHDDIGWYGRDLVLVQITLQSERLRNSLGLQGIFSFKYKAYIWALMVATRDLNNNDENIRITTTLNYHFLILVKCQECYMSSLFNPDNNFLSWDYCPHFTGKETGDVPCLHRW